MAKENQMPNTARVQVFDLTMDNPEDQDKLNRELLKPGEPNNGSSAVVGREVQDESTTESAKKKSRTALLPFWDEGWSCHGRLL
ncbi:MAG: hypothetical protein HYX68_04765 [Planctomycetes bacterium]|nr:hypothetical protein [Planctomycetota bacterium]